MSVCSTSVPSASSTSAACFANIFFRNFSSLSPLHFIPHLVSANINGILVTQHNNASTVYVHPAFNFANIGCVTALPPAPNQHLRIFNYPHQHELKLRRVKSTLATALADLPGCKSNNRA